jgi:modulator of FtsH protease HflC
MVNDSKKYLIGGLLVLIVLLMSMFQVTQGSKALLLRFGRLVVDSKDVAKVYDPGLHFKVPFINRALHFDVRLQTMGGSDGSDVASLLTKEQKYVLVDYFVKWRVADVALYYQRTGGHPRKAEVLLRQSIDDALRAAFGERTITEVVSGQRSDVMDLTRTAVDKSAEYLGIDVIDVRVKRIDLPKEVSDSVYERMRAERMRIATRHRADGQKEGEKIRAQVDADVTVLLAKASAAAAKTRAKGRAKAASIYDNAYSKHESFYAFMQSLIAYEKTFSSMKDVLVLQPDSEFFNYFKSDQGDK